MCELYLHASDTRTSDHPRLAEFLDHSREPHDNPDGWGVAFHLGDDAHLFHEPVPAHASELARWVVEHPKNVSTVVAHIRAASTGDVTLANTQPLSRVIGQKRILFAHNGSVKPLKESPRGEALCGRALGTADSEVAFLAFVDWACGRALADCVEDFPDFAARMCDYGPFNVIITDGVDVLAHSDRRKHTGESEFRGPGLYLQRPRDGSLLLTSQPLMDACDPVPEGTTLHIRGSRVLRRMPDEELEAAA